MDDVNLRIARYLPDARRGDRRAFTEVVKSTQTTVTSIALAIVRDVHSSEDIAQEVFLRVWRQLDQLRNPESFLPWLRQITRNLARDHERRLKTSPGGHLVDDSGPPLAKILDESPGVEADLMAKEEAEVLRSALDAMPADSREIVTLYYREGRSAKQLSRLLGISESAVRQRMTRARKWLRADVESTLESALVRSSPGAAFTMGVGTLLAAGSPPPAAAAASALGAKAALKGAALSGLGLFLGALGGVAGIVLGLRPLLKAPLDERERRALLKQRRIGVLFVLLAIVGFALVSDSPGWHAALLVYLAFLLALTWDTQVALPRILERRLQAERSTDPDAAQKQRHARRLGLLGLIGGGLTGFLGLLAGLLASGRIV